MCWTAIHNKNKIALLLTSAPFLLDFRLNEVRFFFLLDFSEFWGLEKKVRGDIVNDCGKQRWGRKMWDVSLTWTRLGRMIQVGGMITAAWAPSVQGSSICCSMKHVTLLWYCRKTQSKQLDLNRKALILFLPQPFIFSTAVGTSWHHNMPCSKMEGETFRRVTLAFSTPSIKMLLNLLT